MAVTLVINSGSSSQKIALYRDGAYLLACRFEEGDSGFTLCFEDGLETSKCLPIEADVYSKTLPEALRIFCDRGLIRDSSEVDFVGVRIVAPGEIFANHAIIDDEYISQLSKRAQFAPLHIPEVIKVLEIVKKTLPKSQLIGVSDSAFHSTIKAPAYSYSFPEGDVKEFGLRRYGYHGMSVASVVRKMKAGFGEIPDRAIVLHIGSGVSVTALKDGHSIETSMGFSPASGVMMGSRAGDVDAGALLGLMSVKNFTDAEAHDYLNTAGGFHGVAGFKDFRFVLKRFSEGDAKAQLAMEMFVHQITKLVGSYYAVLGGLDAVILTATAAERNPELRNLLLSHLSSMGIVMDSQKNEDLINREGNIEADNSEVKIRVMRTDEMGEMAKVVEEFTE